MLNKTTVRNSLKHLSLILVICMLCTLMPAFRITASAEDGVPYLDETGTPAYADDVVALVNSDIHFALDNPGWYYVPENTHIICKGGIAIVGNMHIILSNNSSLTVTDVGDDYAGIQVESGDSLTIYANSTDPDEMGKLSATGSGSYMRASAGIGSGNGNSGGTITINGGNITAIGGAGEVRVGGDIGGAGIGGGVGGHVETITINGGNITATGTGNGAGIGGGSSGANPTNGGNANEITINGGIITATSIGGGHGNSSVAYAPDEVPYGRYGGKGNIIVNGGVIVASNIGGGNGGLNGNGGTGTVVINGGSISAGNIGGGRAGNGTSGGSGWWDMWWIPPGNAGGGSVTINGGSVKATSVQPAPTNTSDTSVYPITIPEQADVKSVMVDTVINYNINANHSGDNGIYLYLPYIAETTETHTVTVTTESGGAQTYTIRWYDGAFRISTLVDVTYNVGGAIGTTPDAQIIPTYTTITLPPAGDLTWDDKTFVGWNDGTKTYGPGATYRVLDDVTLSVVWGEKVPYLDADGSQKQVNGALPLLGSDTQTTLVDGWYYVPQDMDVSYPDGLIINGDVKIILSNGSTLTSTSDRMGIQVSSGNALTIYANSVDPAQMGAMTANNTDNHSPEAFGIGGYDGTITINGGIITATANGEMGMESTGIGGMGSNVTINGGIITATATAEWSEFITGIGGMDSNITINGGIITATANGEMVMEAAGIGGRYGSNITIDGGSIRTNNMTADTITTSDGDPVFIGVLKNQSGVTSVMVDGTDYNINANYTDGDDNLYLYMPYIADTMESHEITVTTDAGEQNYTYVYYDGAFYNFISCAVTYDINGATGTTPTQPNVNTFTEIILPLQGDLTIEKKCLVGWNDGTKTHALGDTYMVLGSVILTAVWYNIIPYIEADGTQKETVALPLLGGDTQTTLSGGWYYVPQDADVSYPNGLIIDGDVKIILSNGSQLTVQGATRMAGIQISDANSLTTYANITDSDEMGKLFATGDGYGGAGIGTGFNGGNSGTITINGGAITAIGSTGSGIGGGYGSNGGTFTMNGGIVNAASENNASGIGGGAYGNGGTIIINGGAVIATGQGEAVGIGAGLGNTDGEMIIITGGTITANSTSGKGIKGSIKIDGGSIKGLLENTDGDCKTTDGISVYPVTIENQANVQSVITSGTNYHISANHPGDDNDLYLYLPYQSGVIEAHQIKVVTSNGTNIYIYKWEIDQYVLAQPTASFVVSDAPAGLESIVDVPVSVTSASQGDYKKINFALTYNPAIIEYKGLTIADNYQGALTSVTDDPAGTLTGEITMPDAAPIAVGDLFTLQFETKVTDVETDLVLTVTQLNDTAINPAFIIYAQGTINIKNLILSAAEAAVAAYQAANIANMSKIDVDVLALTALKTAAETAVNTYRGKDYADQSKLDEFDGHIALRDNEIAAFYAVEAYEASPITTIDEITAALLLEQAAQATLGEIAGLTPASKEYAGLKSRFDAARKALNDSDLGLLIAFATQKEAAATYGSKNGDHIPAQETIFTNAIADAQSVLDNASRTIEEVKTAVVTLQSAIGVFDGSIVVVDYDDLNELALACTAIHDNATEGDGNNQYEPGSKSIFKSAITAADDIAKDSRATQAQVNDAIEALTTARDTFAGKKVDVNYDVLNSLIITAQNKIDNSTFGDKNGDYPLAAKITLEESIAAAALVVQDDTATQAAVNTAKDTLQNAITTFNNAKIVVIYTDLNNLITTANLTKAGAMQGDGNDQTPTEAFNVLQTAIDAALAIANDDYVSQNTVDVAITPLNNAINLFNVAKIVVDFNTLDNAIAAGKATKYTRYTDETWNALQTAITNAEAIRQEQYVMQTEADQAAQAIIFATNGLKMIPPGVTTNNFVITFEYRIDGTIVSTQKTTYSQSTKLTELNLVIPAGYELVEKTFDHTVTKTETVSIEVKKPETSPTSKPTQTPEPTPTSPLPTTTPSPQEEQLPYIGGYPDGTFKPDSEITRAEVMQMLYNMIGNNAAADLGVLDGFSDMKDPHWADTALAWAVAENYLSGYENATIMPDASISRAELATILSRVAMKKGLFDGMETILKNFNDIDGHWAYADIMALAAKGIAQGYDDGSFGPDNDVTRAETVVMFARLFKRTAEFKAGKTFTDVPQDHWAYTYIMNAANGE